MQSEICIGYWLVAWLDLQGIRRKLLETDFLPGDDAAAQARLIAGLKASVGCVRTMREWLQKFFEGKATVDPEGKVFAGLPPEFAAEAQRLRRTRVRRDAMSDGVIVACPLEPEDGHFPTRGVFDGITACMTLMLVQLGAGRPIRGGLDVGTGLEIDGELFGAAFVKAYELESKRAKHPRLLVGQGLVDYLRASLQTPGEEFERQLERKLANDMLDGLVKRDEDGEWIVHYAGPFARKLAPTYWPDLLDRARAFARTSRAQFSLGTDNESRKLFERYSKLLRYLESSGP